MVLFIILITSKHNEERQNNHAIIIKASYNSFIKNNSEVELSESLYKKFVDSLLINQNQQYTVLKVNINNVT